MEAFIKWRCSKCWQEYNTQEEAVKCEAHHGNPKKVRKATIGLQIEVDGVPSRVDVLMDNGRVIQYHYSAELDKTTWPKGK